MGLDMYLTGEKFIWQSFDKRKAREEDGFSVEAVNLRLGYWRKHPNLHGYIVTTFAKGVDECQRIDLSRDNLRTIIDAVMAKSLPHTDGFFFGESDGSEDESTIAIFKKAIAWLDSEPHGQNGELPAESRSVFYRASW